MKVKALRSFGSPFGPRSEGEVFDLPEGVDWIKAGFVEEVKEEKPKRGRKPRKSNKSGGNAD